MGIYNFVLISPYDINVVIDTMKFIATESSVEDIIAQLTLTMLLL